MATIQNIAIRKGRTGLVTVTVSGISDWTGLTAKFNASRKKGGTIYISLEGVITEIDNTITFTFDAETTRDLVGWDYHYEVTLYRDDETFIKDVVYGLFAVRSVVTNNPAL